MKQAAFDPGFDHDKARAYWLGCLSEEEQARLEAVWFADEDLYEQFQAAQHDVFDAYVRGTLSPAERSSFERQHGASPFVRERLQFASALAEHVNATSPLVPETTATSSWWQRMQEFFGATATGWQFNWQLSTAGAALLLLSVVSVWWLSSSPTRQTGTEQAQAQPSPAASPTNLPVTSPTVAPVSTPAPLIAQQTPPAPPTKPARLFAVTLLPLAFRDGSDLTRLTLPAEAQSAQLVLQLPNATPEQTFTVSIETSEERVVLRRAQLKPQLAQGQWQLRLTLPAALLAADDYVIKATARAAAGTEAPSALYQLRVLRP